jgi:predicted dehydrogenase
LVKRWNELSVLIVGCGSAGQRHARVLNSLGVSDIRACDPAASQRNSLLAQVSCRAVYESLEAGLADRPEAVLIATPPALHICQAIAAVRAGAHVLCEKPLSNTYEGVAELEALVRQLNKKAMVALCFRYHVGHLKAKQYLDSRRLGRLVSIRALMGEHLPEVRPDYRHLFTSTSTGAFDLMHDIDLAIWYSGGSIQEVSCLSGNFSDIGIDAPDLVEMLLQFDNRCMASIHLDLFQKPRRRVTELICTNGVITIDFGRWDHCTISLYEPTRGDWEVEQLATDRDDMFRAEDREFLEAVAEDKPIQCTIAEASKSLQAVVMAYRPRVSAQEQTGLRF